MIGVTGRKVTRFDSCLEEIKRLIQTLQPREKIQSSVLSQENLRRMAATVLFIPRASNPDAKLLDIGGTVYWIPIYVNLLGYKHICILERPGGAFCEDLRIPNQGNHFVVDFIQADSELDVYPIASQSVDCVACFHLLEHLAGDPMHLLAESNRVLKQGGDFCLSTPNVLYFENMARFLLGGHPFNWAVYTDSYADRHNREYTPNEVRKLLEAGGFHLNLLKTQSHTTVTDKRIRVLGYCLSLLGALSGRVSLELREAEIQARGTKVSGVVERYPSFLYDLFGADRVTFKIRTRSLSKP
jgi:SAM-dependent methyltransferase